MEDAKKFWLISVPKATQGEDEYSKMNRVTLEKSLSEGNYKFDIPTLRVGNMDTLVALTDELKKTIAAVETTLRKIAQQYFEVARAEGEDKKTEIEVRGASAESFLTRFRWDDARYQRSKPMPDLVATIRSQVTKMETRLKDYLADYQSVNQQLAQVNQSQSGSLLTRDFSSSVSNDDIVESDFMTTAFVVVQRNDVKEWEKSYESLSEYVVPRSAKKLAEESDYSLFSVILFKKFYSEFQNECRSHRFTVRKLENSQKLSEEDQKALKTKQAKLKRSLVRWTLTNFGEVFLAWVHLKCIHCFVESILRFGLPPDFQAVLIQPKSSKLKHLEKTLTDLYKHLAPGEDGRAFDAEEELKHGALLGGDKFFPFVFLEVDLSLK